MLTTQPPQQFPTRTHKNGIEDNTIAITNNNNYLIIKFTIKEIKCSVTGLQI